MWWEDSGTARLSGAWAAMVPRACPRRGGRGASRHLVAAPAARLVRLFRADHDDRLVVEGRDAVDDALGSRRRLAADDADGLELVHFLREREQRRHGTERLAAEVEVEARADHAMAARHQ